MIILPSDELWSTRRAATEIGYRSQRSVQLLIARGALPARAVDDGQRFVLRRVDVESYAIERRRKLYDRAMHRQAQSARGEK